MDALANALNAPGAPRAAEVARALGVTDTTVHEWRIGRRPVPVQHCIALERILGGAVTRRDLRPTDWHLIWPEQDQHAAQPQQAPAAITAVADGEGGDA